MSGQIEKNLWKKANRYVRILQIVPFLKVVAVCNNLAFGNVDDKSDIDLFIIARRGRLFTVRLFVTFLLHVFGVRRHGSKVSSRFCLSFFIDDETMNMAKVAITDDFYLAYWLAKMIPLIDVDSTVDKFVNENVWAKNYFLDELKLSVRKDKILKNSRFFSFLNKIFGWVLNNTFGDFVERKLKKWQMNRANNKLKIASETLGIIIDEHILKFHNVDRRRYYRDKWLQKYGRDVELTDEKFLSLKRPPSR